MESRDQILRSIRENQPRESSLPDLNDGWINYENLQEAFCQSLEAVGGTAVLTKSIEQIPASLKQLPNWRESGKVCCAVPDLQVDSLPIDQIEDPHELHDLDWTIFQGELGVAENAAIWTTDRQLRHRCVLFIAQHLAVVLRTDDLVHNMHEAYDRIGPVGDQFGLFMSGPSKTADIEQSLVIGAHGARSLTVFLISPELSS